MVLAQQIVPPSIADEQKAFDHAIRLERLKQFDEAEKIYRALLEKNPRNTRVYLQLKALYKKTEKFSELELLIRQHLLLFPQDLQSHTEVGELYLNHGETGKALEHWEQLIQQNSHSQIAYRIVMQMYIRHQMNEQLNNLIQRGRTLFNDPSLFSLDLGNVYSRSHNYEKATHEFLTYAIYHPNQIQVTSAQLLRMSDDQDSQPIIETKLLERMPENENVVRTLYCDFLFKTGRYSDALPQHLALGIETEKDLDRWLRFANNLRKENQLSFALEAFSIILDNIPHDAENPKVAHYRKLTGQALYGLALTYEKQILPSEKTPSLAEYSPNNVFFENHYYGLQTIQIQPLEETFALYDSILVSLPRSTFSPQAHYRLGEIKFYITRDYDGALESFQSAQVLSKDPKLTQNITSRISDVYMAKGQLSAALVFLDGQLARSKSNVDKNKYLLKKCQVLFLSGEVDSTLFFLNKLISYLDISDDQLNDALELRAFIEENYIRSSGNGKKAFQMYLKGEHLLKQAKLSEARSLLNEVAQSYPESPIADEAMYRKAKIDVILGSYADAISTFFSLQASPLADRATIMIGEIYDFYLNDKEEAVQWYLTVLEDYDSSLLTEPVRYRIREISRESDLN